MDSKFLRLAEGCHLKRLEEPCAYHVPRDELYELSEEALDFLARCDGARTVAELRPEEEFLSYCLEEAVLEVSDHPHPREIRIGVNEIPSLRYLMVEVTDRCNLRCRHCYLGDAGSTDLDPGILQTLLDDFDDMGGLRLMITGGEPLLYPGFPALNESLAGRSFRPVLITNGTLLRGEDMESLNFTEIQFSVDGLEDGHDYLRGRGSFTKVMESLQAALSAGIDVSVATVIHARNLGELEGLGAMLSEMGVSAWNLEYPVVSGRLEENPDLVLKPEVAAPYFELEWGWGAHEGAPGYACGAHLAAVGPGGYLVKCGYYRDISGGHLGKGLRQAWRDLPKMKLEGECASCELLAECGGGCRFRAQTTTGAAGPDPLMCARMGRHLR
ncbi:MAG: radical SAM protein [Actinobacteria bacterium]|nr:radical SAM protein [Actinomycetota bacterium]